MDCCQILSAVGGMWLNEGCGQMWPVVEYRLWSNMKYGQMRAMVECGLWSNVHWAK